MTNYAAKIAGIATLALAALPVAALTTAAHAAPAPVRVAVADLDLNSKAGLTTFDARVQKAGVHFCRDAGTLVARDNCEAAIRAEAREKLAQFVSNRSAPAALAAR